jgi:hypothetical protein
MGEAIGQVAIIGDQQQTLSVSVEASGRIQSLSDARKKVQHGSSSAPVHHCGEGAAGLVEEDVALGLKKHPSPIHLNAALVRVNHGCGGVHHLTIHGHATGADKVSGPPAGGQPGGSDEL